MCLIYALSLQTNVGLVAINDSYILESCIYRILKNHFSREAYYIDLVELFHEVRCAPPKPSPSPCNYHINVCPH